MTALDKFMAQVHQTDCCWFWLGYNQRGGHGRLRVGGQLILAHRYAWQLFVGTIPNGMNVLHKCDIAQCVNPEHLFLGSQADNLRDAKSKGTAEGLNAFKTHCPKGHEYSDVNTYTTIGGRRHCKSCHRIRERGRYANRKRVPSTSAVVNGPRSL